MSHFRVLAAAAVLAVGGLAMSAPSHALVIFSDDFERSASNTVGNGWSERQKNAGDVAIVAQNNGNRYVRLRDTKNNLPSAGITQSLNAAGLHNLRLHYDWRGKNAEAADLLAVQWRGDTGGWNTVAQHALNQNSFTFNAVKFVGAYNVTNLRFRFVTSVNGSNEMARIDNVWLKADKIPEPATLSLLGLGLLGAGIARRRKNR